MQICCLLSWAQTLSASVCVQTKQTRTHMSCKYTKSFSHCRDDSFWGWFMIWGSAEPQFEAWRAWKGLRANNWRWVPSKSGKNRGVIKVGRGCLVIPGPGLERDFTLSWVWVTFWSLLARFWIEAHGFIWTELKSWIWWDRDHAGVCEVFQSQAVWVLRHAEGDKAEWRWQDILQNHLELVMGSAEQPEQGQSSCTHLAVQALGLACRVSRRGQSWRWDVWLSWG